MSSFFRQLVERAFPHARVDMLPDRDAYRVSVIVTSKDLAARQPERVLDTLRGLSPTRHKRRRLHWGRCRPSSGVLRLEQRGRFGMGIPQRVTRDGDVWVNNRQAAP